jgi:hypothetical protein
VSHQFYAAQILLTDKLDFPIVLNHFERHAQRNEMLQATPQLVRFSRSQLQEVFGAFRFSNKVKRFVIMLHNRPIGVVLAHGRVNLESARQLDEEFDVLALI